MVTRKTPNSLKLQAMRELKKREKLEFYKHNFEEFCRDQIKVLPKNAEIGRAHV